MKPARKYVQETLSSIVSETFDRCMKSALRFPHQKRELNQLANDTAKFQIEMMNEIRQSSSISIKKSRGFLDDFNSKIEIKKKEIENELKNLIDVERIEL